MNEFYEHPAVMEIIRDYQSISMTINLNHSKIKNNLKHFESILEQYMAPKRCLSVFRTPKCPRKLSKPL